MLNKKREYIKSISRKIFWTQFILSLIFFGSVAGAVFFYADKYLQKLKVVNISKIYPPNVQGLLTDILKLEDPLYLFLIPTAIGIVVIFTLLTWIILRSVSKGVIERMPVGSASSKEVKEPKEDPELEKRKFLHLLSVLQEEGRFLDFLSEDLSSYEDEEIGAAVRSIHKGCLEGLNKYIDLKPLIDEEEDSYMEVPQNFNPDKIKLTGNVVGEPPFKGIVRHRGWKADNINLPDLKKTADASFLIPAEIEVE